MCHVLQHYKRLQFTRHVYLYASPVSITAIISLNNIKLLVCAINMQRDFCKLGTANTLEYHLGEFQAFLIFLHFVS
jgi:hypothetical protein